MKFHTECNSSKCDVTQKLGAIQSYNQNGNLVFIAQNETTVSDGRIEPINFLIFKYYRNNLPVKLASLLSLIIFKIRMVNLIEENKWDAMYFLLLFTMG